MRNPAGLEHQVAGSGLKGVVAELDAWQAVQDPGARLRLGLGQLYGWYRETGL
jgi:hypothetical protein